ncbi:anti-sigma factor [Thiohalorhabdus sp. Cl-TMA]|uniref:Regulator of SigK n=1 Tax=Thiohalorhabdus methylotrophus TaxID=3242694 RepID=A0ABV4TXQ7_9GAMM
MSENHSEEHDLLAAEYVLGTLAGAERARFEQRLAEEPELRRRVAAWESRLGALVEETEPVEPPPGVWRAVLHRLEGQPERPGFPRGRRVRWLWNSLPFWRGTATAAVVLLLVTGVWALGPASTPAVPDRMVMVRNQESQPVWVVTADRDAGVLRVRTVRRPGMGPDRVCPLWLQWENGRVTRMVGVLPEKPGTHTLPLPEDMENPLPGSRVVVSVEPRSGMPLDKPRGKVVFRESWIRL